MLKGRFTLGRNARLFLQLEVCTVGARFPCCIGQESQPIWGLGLCSENCGIQLPMWAWQNEDRPSGLERRSGYWLPQEGVPQRWLWYHNGALL